MQPITAEPRDELGAADVTALLQDSPAIIVGAGLELIDRRTMQVVDDLSDILETGKVGRNSYATLHGTATFVLADDLDWGVAVVRPYLELTDSVRSARFRLGGYFTSSPDRTVKALPQSWTVTGYDVLHALTSPVGGAYAVDTGTRYLDAVSAILTAQGYGGFLIDQAAADKVLPSPKVWAFDDKTTWLRIVNDLLAAIGYQGIWSDWDGRLRCQPYRSPRDRGSEWKYTVDQATTMLGPERKMKRDFFNAPNRWVFFRQSNVDGPPPVEGAGIYTYVNQVDGDTSVNARGRVISKVVGVDAADQDALEAAARITIDADMRPNIELAMTTFPNPLHWHFDRVTLIDPQLGQTMEVVCTEWSLPFDGSDQTHSWTVL